MEIENEEEAGAFKDDDLVAFVLEGDVGLGKKKKMCMSALARQPVNAGSRIHLRRLQPPVLGLEVVHLGVKVVEVPVPKELVLRQVELTAGIVERVIVSGTGKIEPLQSIRGGDSVSVRERRRAVRDGWRADEPRGGRTRCPQS